MSKKILGAAAAAAMTLFASTTVTVAQDLSWGCVFDKATGKTYCLEVAESGNRHTGNIIVSRPNIGLPGEYQSNTGQRVRVYLNGNRAGRQPFHWQK